MITAECTLSEICESCVRTCAEKDLALILSVKGYYIKAAQTLCCASLFPEEFVKIFFFCCWICVQRNPLRSSKPSLKPSWAISWRWYPTISILRQSLQHPSSRCASRRSRMRQIASCSEGAAPHCGVLFPIGCVHDRIHLAMTGHGPENEGHFAGPRGAVQERVPLHQGNRCHARDPRECHASLQQAGRRPASHRFHASFLSGTWQYDVSVDVHTRGADNGTVGRQPCEGAHRKGPGSVRRTPEHGLGRAENFVEQPSPEIEKYNPELLRQLLCMKPIAQEKREVVPFAECLSCQQDSH